MALHHTILLYEGLTSLYFTRHQSHGFTSLYFTLVTLTWLYLTLLDSTSLYINPPLFYFILLDSTQHFHGSTSLYLTLHHSPMALLYST